jgi:CheY-like chemotaxis protein
MTSGPILVVDDDLDIREILAETLGERGFDVVAAANGLEALELVQSMPAPPSVILLDLMMPVMDGYTFLERRAESPALASIPVAIITAGHRVDRARLGNRAFIIPKPIDVRKLVGVLHDLRSRPPSSA